MKEASIAHWTAPNTGADNSSGFTALGVGNTFSGSSRYIGKYAYWWSSNTFITATVKNALQRMVSNDYTGISRYGTSQENGFSVRYIKN